MTEEVCFSLQATSREPSDLAGEENETILITSVSQKLGTLIFTGTYFGQENWRVSVPTSCFIDNWYPVQLLAPVYSSRSCLS